MATAATSLLGLALPVTGELSGTWGDTVNVSITALLDTAVAGTTTLSSDADVTLTTTTLAANQARQAIILWTAGGTVTRTITVPAQSKSYIVINKTSSSQSIKIVGVGPTTGVTIVAGTAAFVVWNGVDFVTASVTSTTGILPVANGGTGLSSGTSGGVLAYTATGTLASSAALAASALVIGGGAGAAPSTTTTGTGVVTALGVNTGTAGAFVVNGGALGSPSSVGTMPAFTLGGTVSGGGNQINNVVIGTTTPLAGSFTTLSATGTISGTASNTFSLNNSGGGAIDNVQQNLFLQTPAGTSFIFREGSPGYTTRATLSSTALALQSGVSLTGGTSGTGYSFSGSAPATSLTLTAAGQLLIGTATSISGSNLTIGDGSGVTTAVQYLNAGTGGAALLGRISGSNTWLIGDTITAVGTGTGLINYVYGANPWLVYINNVERARIDSSGNLLVGKTSDTTGVLGWVARANGTGIATVTEASTNEVFIWDNTSTAGTAIIDFRAANVTKGRISWNNTVTVYATTSDYRLKTVIGPVADAGQRIDALKPIDYLWTEGNTPARGFLAHEFQEVYAGSVTGTKDAVDEDGKPVYQAMQASSSEVIADLVAELQSLRSRVAELEAKA